MNNLPKLRNIYDKMEDDTKLKSSNCCRVAFWLLVAVIAIQSIWFFSRLIQDKSPEWLLNSMMFAELVTELYLIYWSYCIHVDLKKVFFEYNLRPSIASLLFLPYIRLFGIGIVFYKLARRLKETQGGLYEKTARFLKIWLVLYYLTTVLVGTTENYRGHIDQLVFVSATWIIPYLLGNVAMLALVKCTTAAIFHESQVNRENGFAESK